jgi:hypothetical protein
VTPALDRGAACLIVECGLASDFGLRQVALLQVVWDVDQLAGQFARLWIRKWAEDEIR